MSQQTEITQLLDLMIQPGFCVQDHIIVEANPSAKRLLVSLGTDVRAMLLSGLEEYEAFENGCLYLQLNLGENRCGAAVMRMEHFDVFVLDPESENSELYALALAAQDLRGPMSSVMIAADQISQAAAEAGSSAAVTQAGQLTRGLHQLFRIINNMSDALMYTEISQQETRNLTAVFAEIFEKAQVFLEKAGLHLTYHGLQEDVYALADAQQLERAVLNVLSNAAKFTPVGGNVTARLTRRGNLLRLSMEDSGAGIQEDILHQIFHRYLRHPGIEDSRFGLGLGMVLIRAAAANHGGTVLIDQPGGTRITITMALRQNTEGLLRSPLLRVDYTGGWDHTLVELSQRLPAALYERGKK